MPHMLKILLTMSNISFMKMICRLCFRLSLPALPSALPDETHHGINKDLPLMKKGILNTFSKERSILILY
jgi:hypothetical protein